MAEDDDDRDETRDEGGDGGQGTKVQDGDDAEDKAKAEEQEVEEAKEKMKELEEGDPPENLEDWPGGKAKYQTYGGPDSGDGGYEDGATAKLGPSNLRHHEDGSVTVDGEEVDNPEDYKGEPIPGGPSDPDAPPDPAMIGQENDDEDDDSGSDDDDSGDDDSREDDDFREDDDDSGDDDDDSGEDDDDSGDDDSRAKESGD